MEVSVKLQLYLRMQPEHCILRHYFKSFYFLRFRPGLLLEFAIPRPKIARFALHLIAVDQLVYDFHQHFLPLSLPHQFEIN